MGKYMPPSLFTLKAMLLQEFGFDEGRNRSTVQQDEETSLTTLSSSSNDSQDTEYLVPTLRQEQRTRRIVETLPWFTEESSRKWKFLDVSLWIEVACSWFRNGRKPDYGWILRDQQILSVVFLIWLFVVLVLLVRRGGELPLHIGDIPTPSQAKEAFDFIRQSQPSNLFTIRTKGSRLHQISQMVDHYSKCPQVKEIQVTWTAGPELSSRLWNNPKVQENGAAEPTTNAILLLDSNMPHLSCQEIDRAFAEWRRDPLRLVGFVPLFNNHRGYSLVSNHALFVHLRYLNLFGDPLIGDDDCLSYSLAAKWVMHSKLPPTAIQSETIPPVYDGNCNLRLLRATHQVDFPFQTVLFSGPDAHTVDETSQ